MSDTGSGQPAGWYYAQGDPPATQRYWDGTQWVGGPQPVGGVADGSGLAPPGSSGAGISAAADVGPRFIGFLVDFGVHMGAAVVVNIIGAVSNSAAIEVLGSLGLLAFWIWNLVIKQSQAGQTIGKGVANTRIVMAATGETPSKGRLLGRTLLHSVLSVFSCFLFWLVDAIWVFVDQDNKRLIDKMLGTRVVNA